MRTKRPPWRPFGQLPLRCIGAGIGHAISIGQSQEPSRFAKVPSGVVPGIPLGFSWLLCWRFAGALQALCWVVAGTLINVLGQCLSQNRPQLRVKESQSNAKMTLKLGVNIRPHMAVLPVHEAEGTRSIGSNQIVQIRPLRSRPERIEFIFWIGPRIHPMPDRR